MQVREGGMEEGGRDGGGREETLIVHVEEYISCAHTHTDRVWLDQCSGVALSSAVPRPHSSHTASLQTPTLSRMDLSPHPSGTLCCRGNTLCVMVQVDLPKRQDKILGTGAQ